MANSPLFNADVFGTIRAFEFRLHVMFEADNSST